MKDLIFINLDFDYIYFYFKSIQISVLNLSKANPVNIQISEINKTIKVVN